MAKLEIETIATDGEVRLLLAGEIDLSTVANLVRTQGRALDDAAAGAVRAVVVDLERVTFLDSTGIGALAGGHRRAQELNLGYRVANASGMAARVLEVTGLLHLTSDA